MYFKDISYLELWPPFRLLERIYLCNCGRGHHEEHFCEIILNLDQQFRNKRYFLSRALVDLLFSDAEAFTKCNCDRGHWTSGSGDVI